MRYDFHIHTREYSACAVSTAEQICFKAAEAGLAGIALTEHKVWWPLPKIQKLRKQFTTLTIMRGIEYSCPEGHFLVFLPNPENGKLPTWCSVLDLIPMVHHYGGVVIWAHPFRFDSTWPDWLDYSCPDGIEVASSNMHRRAETMATRVASERGILMLRNSDAHHRDTVGSHGNELDASLECVEDFIKYVRESALAPPSRSATSSGCV
ncbi:MAG: PHP domain-containing protein [Deltaproteobacteria bacterium]|nr:MAG: PHP domain-containing protein [Deltaproteobacteria bacterium]